MPKLHEPFTLPKHPKLLEEINQNIIAIKVWHVIDFSKENPEAEDKLKAHNPAPEWKDIANLLRRAYDAINEQREDPRKY